MKTSTFSKSADRRVSVSPFRRSIGYLLFAGLMLGVQPIRADDVGEINKLMQSGQYIEALSRIDAALVQKPRDPQLRHLKSLTMFMRGLVLAEQGKTNEAITVFTRLTDEFPELPEPYNNLGVLYASMGQYEKSRSAFEMAIKTNPSYATALENLGDVYAKMASQAYDRALQLDNKNTDAKSKLTLIRTLMGQQAKPYVVPAVPAAEKAPPVESTVDEKRDVMDAVYRWAHAWSARDVKTYLSAYSDNFKLPEGVTRESWAEQRRIKIEGKRRIDVRVDSPSVAVNGNVATVKFRQIYSSDRLSSRDWKILELEKVDGRWQIRQERSSS